MQIETDIKSFICIYFHRQYSYSLWSILLHWLSVQAVRIIQMPCKCLSLKQLALALNVAHKSCSLLPSLKNQGLRQKPSVPQNQLALSHHVSRSPLVLVFFDKLCLLLHYRGLFLKCPSLDLN